MQRDFDQLELLALWWKAEREWTPVQGYPTECPSTRGWRSSRQYDDTNGAEETDARGMLIRHVSQAVNSIQDPHRTALYMLARNHVNRAAVWQSARLPQDQDERAALVAEALEMFCARV